MRFGRPPGNGRKPRRGGKHAEPMTCPSRLSAWVHPGQADEGLRIGTVRRPPRGVAKAEFSAQNWYDVWFPNLAPSAELMQQGKAVVSEAEWSAFARAYRAEMAAPGARHDIELLAGLSHQARFSVGCYCEREQRCHRSLLRALLAEAGAQIATPAGAQGQPGNAASPPMAPTDASHTAGS